jgi:hypothetical protein
MNPAVRREGLDLREDKVFQKSRTRRVIPIAMIGPPGAIGRNSNLNRSFELFPAIAIPSCARDFCKILYNHP